MNRKHFLYVISCFFLFYCFQGTANELTDVSTLDAAWASEALPLDGCGYQEVEDQAQLLTMRYQGKGHYISMAFPYYLHCIECKLKKPADLGRLVLLLEKLQPAGENDVGLDGAMVFTSDDGATFTPATAEATTLFYKEENNVFTRVTFSGHFRGQYFRVYVPRSSKDYVYGFKHGLLHPASGKYSIFAFSNTLLKLQNVSLPLRTNGEFPVLFTLNKGGNIEGSAELCLANESSRLLWSAPLSELRDGQPETINVSLPSDITPGILTLKLLVKAQNLHYPIARTLLLRYNPLDTVLHAQTKADWQQRTLSNVDYKMDFAVAEKAGAQLEFRAPANGDFALYATFVGKGSFSITAPNFQKNTSLTLWHPADIGEDVAGENFIGILSLQRGDPIIFTADAAHCTLGEVILSPASAADVALYRSEPVHQPAIIVHSDGFSEFFFSEVTVDSLKQRIDKYAQSHVFAYDWCVGTSAVNYPSKVATIFGHQDPKDVAFWCEGDKLATQRLDKLLDAGIDPIRLQRDYCKLKGVRFSLTVRANAFYPPHNNNLNAQFFLDHPEFRMKGVDGRFHLKPSYAYPEVRQFYLAMIKEMVAYQPDAIVIEFLRHPPFFGYDPPIIDEYVKRHGSCTAKNYMDERWGDIICQIMLEYLKDVRAVIEAANPDMNLEINFDCDDYKKHGLDLPAILAAGLVDMISPGIYMTGEKKYFPLQPFVEMAAKSPRKVKIFPRIEATIQGQDPTPDEEKGLIKVKRRNVSDNMFKKLFIDFHAEGGDGLRPFNGGGPACASAISNRSTLKVFELFEMPLLDVRCKVK